jgi:hypothetical protein
VTWVTSLPPWVFGNLFAVGLFGWCAFRTWRKPYLEKGKDYWVSEETGRYILPPFSRKAK